MRLLPRRRSVPVENTTAATCVDANTLTLTTYNIWNDTLHAAERYRAIARLLAARDADVMVFQEVTPMALEVLLDEDSLRNGYARAAVVGGDAGTYGLLMLSRVPLPRVTYTWLPTRLSRGFLTAELGLHGAETTLCCIHLDSGKSSARLRGWQLRRIFGSLTSAENAVVLGDFNMRESEDARIRPPYRDVWPLLRPGEEGFTEDTSINHMRYDMKDKHRHVRFDRVLLKGDRWTPTDIELLGTQPITDDQPRIFPSDHFGVWCRLTSRSP